MMLHLGVEANRSSVRLSPPPEEAHPLLELHHAVRPLDLSLQQGGAERARSHNEWLGRSQGACPPPMTHNAHASQSPPISRQTVYTTQLNKNKPLNKNNSTPTCGSS